MPTARRRQHVVNSQILCDRPGVEFRRSLVPDMSRQRKHADTLTSLQHELEMVRIFAARRRDQTT